ncbi:hypothetical protein AKJ16_DCAP20390 [Drosera capensis]
MDPTARSVVDGGDRNADPIRIAIRELIASSEIKPTELPVVTNDHGHRQLSVEAMKEDGIVNHLESLTQKPDEPMIEVQTGNVNAGSATGSGDVEEILKELKKVRRQNTITHCLLSTLIVLTAAWQLSEVSLLLKVKEGVSHPFRSLGSMVTKMIKGPGVKGQDSEKQDQTDGPAIKLPELPRLDLPSLDLSGDKEG